MPGPKYTEDDKILAKLVGIRLKKARKALKLTQGEVAGVTDISRAQVANIEGGRIMPSLRVFRAICAGLGIGPKYLLAMDDD